MPHPLPPVPKTFTEYEIQIQPTVTYPEADGGIYTALGLAEEAGEYAGKHKRRIRDGQFDKEAAAKELGDVLWYLSRAAHHLGYSLEDIARMNVIKLYDRLNRNALHGSGDNR